MSKLDIATLDARIKRWKTKMTRAVNAIVKLEKQRARLQKKQLNAAYAETSKAINKVAFMGMPVRKEKAAPDTPPPIQPETPHPADDMAIPGFLQRKPSPRPIDKDAVRAAELKAQVEARKKAKTEARKVQRSKAGRAMPLSGKAALDAIKEAQKGH
jgi:hypothetical protein